MKLTNRSTRVNRYIYLLYQIAFADIGKLIDEQGYLLLINDIDEDTRLALKHVELVTRNVGEGGAQYIYKYQMQDKLGALRNLAKILGMYEKDYNPGTPEAPNQADMVKPADWEPSKLMASLIPRYQRKKNNDE